MNTFKTPLAGNEPLITRRSLLATAAFACASPFAQAQPTPAFPTRPLTWVVPYPAGGFGDAMSRMLAPKIGETLGQTVIVDNRPGAGGQLGASFVKQQPADGHTLLYGDIGPFAMNAALYPKLPYDTLKDFAPLTRLFTSPVLLVVPAESPIRTFADLQKAARQDKGLSYASYGIGSHPHVWGEMLSKRMQGKLIHIPYKGAAPALQDLLGGRIDLMPDVAPSSLPLVREGKLRALAVIGGAQRLAQLPDVPTMAELGYPDLNVPGWNGVMVRSGTPAPIIARLHEAVLAALRSPDVVKRYTDLGLIVAPQSALEFGDFIRTETARWGGVIRQAGIVIE